MKWICNDFDPENMNGPTLVLASHWIQNSNQRIIKYCTDRIVDDKWLKRNCRVIFNTGGKLVVSDFRHDTTLWMDSASTNIESRYFAHEICRHFAALLSTPFRAGRKLLLHIICFCTLPALVILQQKLRHTCSKPQGIFIGERFTASLLRKTEPTSFRKSWFGIPASTVDQYFFYCAHERPPP